MSVSDVVNLERELRCGVEYLANVNKELESVHNVVDSVCIDYIRANRALNGSDSENLLLYQVKDCVT